MFIPSDSGWLRNSHSWSVWRRLYQRNSCSLNRSDTICQHLLTTPEDWRIWRCALQRHRPLTNCYVKPKFHYADFATKSGTSSWQSHGLVADTNHENPRHKSRRQLSWFVSATSPRLVANLSRTLSQTSRHVEMVFVRDLVICVGDFHRNFVVSWFVTVCVRDFHDLCPRLSPSGKFRWKSA